MKQVINISPFALVVMLGISGSGKSTLAQKYFDATEIFSSDELRKNLFGVRPMPVNGAHAPWVELRNTITCCVFPVIESFVTARLSEGLRCVIDATNLEPADISTWKALAYKFGADFVVIHVDTPAEIIAHQNIDRANPVPSEVIKLQSAILENTLKHIGHELFYKPLSLFDVNVLNEFKLDSDAFDVIGDVHGCLEAFLQLCTKLGWTFSEDLQAWNHAQSDRKFLFLGDLVDRGADSLKLLELAMHLVKIGKAVFLKGNHEVKLVKFFESCYAREPGKWSSYANAETGTNALRSWSAEKIQEAIQFIKKAPHYVYSKDMSCVFMHGNAVYFDTKTMSSVCIYGEVPILERFKVEIDPKDTDAFYQWGYEHGFNTANLFRGHIKQTSLQNNVFSLEEGCYENGNICAVPLDKLLNHPKWGGFEQRQAFEDLAVRQETGFDFDRYAYLNYTALKELYKLKSAGLAYTNWDKSGSFCIFKYSKQVFWDHSWGSHDWLMKARGIAFDKGAHIVIHPFDKVFNYKEENAGVDLDPGHLVYVIEKLNGFLGNVALNPFEKTQLLTCTQGYFENDYTKYIQEMMTPAQRGKTLNYLKSQMENQTPLTLMFEVIHPEDTHIVEYTPEQSGLYLIGARGLNLQDQPMTEEFLDDLASLLGYRRPSWKVMTVSQAHELCKTIKHEGFMIRDAKTQEFLYKEKSAYYLITKLIGRLATKNTKFMYNNPDAFIKKKENHIDEEFYDIIFWLVKTVPMETFMAMSSDEKADMIRKKLNEDYYPS